MRIYRHTVGSRYHYYVQAGSTIVRWHPEMTWQSRGASQPEGRLVAEGSAERVMHEVRNLLPADLLEQIERSLEGDEGGDVASQHPQGVAL